MDWIGAVLMVVGCVLGASATRWRVLVDPHAHLALARGGALIVLGAGVAVAGRADQVAGMSLYAMSLSVSVGAAVLWSSIMLLHYSKAPSDLSVVGEARARQARGNTKLQRVAGELQEAK